MARRTTDERSALLAAVCDVADDDGPRLVYADWLEEHGDEVDRDRAAFIRLQLDQARLPEYDPRQDRLGEEARKLLNRHWGAWGPEVAAWARSQWNYERGFVARVDCTPL